MLPWRYRTWILAESTEFNVYEATTDCLIPHRSQTTNHRGRSRCLDTFVSSWIRWRTTFIVTNAFIKETSVSFFLTGLNSRSNMYACCRCMCTCSVLIKCYLNTSLQCYAVCHFHVGLYRGRERVAARGGWGEAYSLRRSERGLSHSDNVISCEGLYRELKFLKIHFPPENNWNGKTLIQG